MRFFVLVGEVNIPKSLMSSVTQWSCQKIMMWPNWLSVQSIYVSCMQAWLLVSASLSRPFYIVRNWSAIRSITRSCVICSRVLAKVQCQLLGQFPADWLTDSWPSFSSFSMHMSRLHRYCTSQAVWWPTLVKAYINIFVSFSVRAVHIELVLDLTTEAFLAAFRRFIAWREKPSVMWSDHCTNFTGANRELQQNPVPHKVSNGSLHLNELLVLGSLGVSCKKQ